MLPALLAKIGLPALVSVLSGSLKSLKHPAAQAASKALETLDEALTKDEVSLEEIQEANRHVEQLAALESEERKNTISEVNASLRTEAVSDRRMRPTFGYLMALTWALQMGAIAYVMVFKTAESHLVIESMESLGMIWSVGLSVLGIYVYKRSEDKKLKG